MGDDRKKSFSSPQQRTEYIMMRGPHGKGQCQVAITARMPATSAVEKESSGSLSKVVEEVVKAVNPVVDEGKKGPSIQERLKIIADTLKVGLQMATSSAEQYASVGGVEQKVDELQCSMTYVNVPWTSLISFREVTHWPGTRDSLAAPAHDRVPVRKPPLCAVSTNPSVGSQVADQEPAADLCPLQHRLPPVHNDGFDNEEYDYILYVNDILGSQDGQQYQILDVLGHGTFGQVVKCLNLKTKELVAVKVIKNKPAYYNQSLVEVAILDMLNGQYDKDDKHHLARMKDTFLFRNHLCIIFEMLSVNLYELIKQNQFRGLSTNLVRVFVSQILDALTVLNRAKIIHCDLKPENILLKNLDSPTIKVIDFGSACHENQTVYTYIQSRFYRSPEVLIGLPYTSSIDMWSVGAIAAELFLGLPLFPGSSEYNQIMRIVEMMGMPPTYMLDRGKTATQFFNRISSEHGIMWEPKSMEQYMK
ncbi:dual specificity protein kinase yak1, partial [Nowakowskiella sp. JEL0407]